MYDYCAGKMDWLAFALPTEGADAEKPRASDVLRRDVPTCRLDDSIGDVQSRLEGTDWAVCGVINEQNILLGMLRGKCWDAPPDALAGDVMPGRSIDHPAE